METRCIDHVEFYAADAELASYFYRTAFGLSPAFYLGPESGLKDRTSIVVMRAGIALVLTSAFDPEHRIARHVACHGDSVRDVAFRVPDAVRAFDEAVRGGAMPVEPPTVEEAHGTRITRATVKAFGDTVHSLVERSTDDVLAFPGGLKLKPKDPPLPLEPSPLVGIDHAAVCLEPGTLEPTVEFYRRAFDFVVIHEENVRTSISSMNSKVVASRTGNVKLALMEPRPGKSRSQIEEFLLFHRGPGVQHLAFLSDDILETARALRRVGVSFLRAPEEYYEELPSRIGEEHRLDYRTVQDLRILVDDDGRGLLFQAFTKPIHSRPTFFMEVIQRANSHGFGTNNVNALFRAIEREQARRGLD